MCDAAPILRRCVCVRDANKRTSASDVPRIIIFIVVINVNVSMFYVEYVCLHIKIADVEMNEFTI